MLIDNMKGRFGKLVSAILIVTTQAMAIHISYAADEMMNAVAEANILSQELLSDRAVPSFNSSGELMIDGEPYISKSDLTGQRDSDYLPASSEDTYGSDANTILQGQMAQDKYEEKTLETAETSAERAYHILKKSFSTQKPDLTNDPIWENTDNVFTNLEEIASDFANCTVSTELVSTGNTYHVPQYETCERLPAIEESFVIGHEYEVGVIKVADGPANLLSCGDGCVKMWAGQVRTEYLRWNGTCTIYEEKSSVEVVNPSAITNAVLEYSKFDDFYQLHLNDVIVYQNPVNYFPPEQGICNWDRGDNVTYPNVNVTTFFSSAEENEIVSMNSRVSIYEGGWGYSRIKINYDQSQVIHHETWTTQENIDKAIQVQDQLNDGFCTGEITCTNMPSLDANGCTTIDGFYVCEDDFSNNPLAELGLSPFCKTVSVESNCGFNDGELCWENMDGETVCHENTTTTTNTCTEYEEDETCSYVKTECVEGAEGASGTCYVQEDTFDCGFDASTGVETEEEVITCDGQIQCIGESCYSPTRDADNSSFGEVNAYLEMLKYAAGDMTCEGVPDAPYNEESPPDRYYPIKTCEEGYTYDADADVCLQQLTCDYSEDDFYAASLRNGIQVVKNGSILQEDSSVPSCVPLTIGGQTYTCGGAMQKVDTDVFYEICTNNVSEPIEEGCPDSSHVLNPETGYCEVPPTPTCPDGVPLIEGDDVWSVEDDKCLLEVDPVPECDDSNLSYDESTGLCYSSSIEYAAAYCESGTLNADNTCAQAVCKYSFNPDAGHILNEKNYLWEEIIENGVVTPYIVTWGGEGGVNLPVYNINTMLLYPHLSKGDYANYSFNVGSKTYKFYEVCNSKLSTNAPTVCPDGYEKSGNNCQKATMVGSEPTLTCSIDGAYYDEYTDTCRVEEPASVGCPSFYPNWNEEEGRCESSLSPLATTTDSIDHQIEFNSHTTKELVDYALSPFEALFSAVIPSAIADESIPETDLQASMNAYVANKLSDASKELEETQEMVISAQAQLASFSSTATTSSATVSASSTSSTSGVGETNVTCELFKGTASECKIAVGGIQNCCKNPVPVSLNDYISLTTNTLQLDAMTGEIFGLDGYAGAWDLAKTGINSAYKTMFSSSTDILTTKATEGAGETLVGEMAKQAMQYTYEVVYNYVGEGAANMLFSTTGTGAGATVTGASPALAAVGSALMVVYYVYLAYVVFTLLVNILFECTDEEFDLAMKRDLLSTHHIGSYCKTEILGACIEKRNVYCQYDSPLSRIMMEQIYKQPQMGLDWGSPKNPHCQGIELLDVSKVDWDAVDLDEWIGILVKTDNFVDMQNIDIESLTGAGSSVDFTEDQSRDNIIERNEPIMDEIDGDEVRRIGYEEAWNENQ